MTDDQQLADAIRERFARHITPRMTGSQEAHLGAVIGAFCDEHPAWQPTPGALAFDRNLRPVVIVGPHPGVPDLWVVITHNELLGTRYGDGLTPRAEQ